MPESYPPDRPTDGLTLGETLAALEAKGYAGQFGADDGGLVRCFACGATTPAGEVGLDYLCRTEGVSDPADMLAVVGLVCPHCGTKGTGTFNYGPEVTAAEGEVLRELHGRWRQRTT